MRRYYPQAKNHEMNEFEKEALRLIKELSVDEEELRTARQLVDEQDNDESKEKLWNQADSIERGIERKMRLIDTLIGVR